MSFTKTTEQDSHYTHLEKMRVMELLTNINKEDKKVALVVEKSLPQIEKVVNKTIEQLQNGGRLFYIGAGTSGRLGILDASECPPTFGVHHELIVGIIAGGDTAIRKSIENAEDSTKQGWLDLQSHQVSKKDIVIGIAASGTTPYVVSTIQKCNENNISTACITMNENSPLHQTAKLPIVCVVGPEFITGSSRMKAGTAQKMILNMITTATMVKLGKVKGNKMVDMQLSNEKLINRGAKMIADQLNIELKKAEKLLIKFGSVRKALDNYPK